MVTRKWQFIAMGGVAYTIAAGWASAQASAESPQLASGREIYAQSCANCHYDGEGNPAAPDLKGSVFWKLPPEAMIHLLLQGQGGVSVVNGRKFNGQMPPMDYLANDEIAAVTAYVRSEFGGKTESVSPELVEKLRSEPLPK